jgi:hypothetical protein
MILKDMKFIIATIPVWSERYEKVYFRNVVFWKGKIHCFLKEHHDIKNCEETLRLAEEFAKDW